MAINIEWQVKSPEGQRDRFRWPQERFRQAATEGSNKVEAKGREESRRQACATVNQVVVLTYWHIGKRIVEEEQNGETRAQYGTRLIKTLAEQLAPKYGNTFGKRNLEYFRQFYLYFNDLEIVNTRFHNLTWSHFRTIIQVADPKAREWYAKEASEQMWSVRTLSRNIGTQYYGRRMASIRKGQGTFSCSLLAERSDLGCQVCYRWCTKIQQPLT